MKCIVVFVLVFNVVLLGVIVYQLVVFVGGGDVVRQNGDSNGDGGWDIIDVVYLFSWFFQGGLGFVEIVCFVDQGDWVVELEVQLVVGNVENVVLQG